MEQDATHSSPPTRRIVWLIQGDEKFGTRQAVVTLATAVRESGGPVSIASLMEGPFAAECRDMGFAVGDLDVGPSIVLAGNPLRKVGGFLRHLRYSKRAAAALTTWLRSEAAAGRAADAVHVQWPNHVSIGGAAARAMDIPCFWEMPNVLSDRYPFGLNRRIYQRQCRNFGIVPLANSRYTAASLGERPVTPRVMHLGVDPRRFDPDRVAPVSRAELGIPEDAIVLAVLGRLDGAKGQDRVLQAMLQVADGDASLPPLHLLLLGADPASPQAAELRSIATAGGATDQLHLLPNRPDPERYYPMIDLPVNARVDAEPYGLSVVEAMMMSRPPLVRALGGPAETVIDGQTGWHIAEASIAAIVAGIRRVLADRRNWPQMRKAARQHALAHFSIDRQLTFYRQVVEQTIADRQSK
jgi:glycosyltransferase involved in cell wall biosynthesis